MVKEKLVATIDKVYLGETPMGSGPGGGNCGRQWMADILINRGKSRVAKYTQCILNKEGHNPTREEMNARCKRAINDYEKSLPEQRAFEAAAKKESREREKINTLAKTIKVSE